MGVVPDNVAPSGVPGQPPTDTSSNIQALGALLQKLATIRGGQQQPQGGGGTPAQMSTPYSPGSPTPVFSTPAPAPVAQSPGAPSPLLGKMGTWFPNAGAAKGATALSAVDSVAQAITSLKQKSDSDNITKAQNTLAMFQNALEKGDMQVANLLASDKKIVKSWEKYLKMEFPRVPGGQPGQLGQLNQPGGIAATRDTTAELLQQLAVQNEQAKQQVQEAQAGELRASAKAYSNEADLYAANAKAVPIKTAADVESANANTTASLAASRLSDAKTLTEQAQLGDVHGLNQAQIGELNAQAAYNYAHAKLEETLAGLGGYTPTQLGGIVKNDLKGLQDMQKAAQQNVLSIQKKMQSKTADIGVKGLSKIGLTTSYEDDLKTAVGQYNSLSKAVKTYSSLQDQVMGGKLKPSEALQQAYDAAGLDTKVQMDAPPVSMLDDKNVTTFQDGSGWILQNGEATMVTPPTRGK